MTIFGNERVDLTARRLGRAANAMQWRGEKLDQACAALGQAVAKLAVETESFDARYDDEPVPDAGLLNLAETKARGALMDAHASYPDPAAFADSVLYEGEPEPEPLGDNEVSA